MFLYFELFVDRERQVAAYCSSAADADVFLTHVDEEEGLEDNILEFEVNWSTKG